MMRILLLFAFLFQTAISHQQQQKKSFDDIIAENKGKVIVIDYWASWCKPCRKEMPAMSKLIKKYKDSNVAFVFISMDQDRQKWTDAAKKEGIADAVQSYMTDDVQKTDFSRSLKINAIPRYLLFDKNGNLVNTEAPHPSEEKLQQEIDQYLSK